jgi:hypothetical protein
MTVKHALHLVAFAVVITSSATAAPLNHECELAEIKYFRDIAASGGGSGTFLIFQRRNER